MKRFILDIIDGDLRNFSSQKAVFEQLTSLVVK